jgi:hypothetical protein
MVWRALALQRAPISAQFPAQRARFGKQRTRKLLQQNKNGCGTAIEFCGYTKVLDANPTDLRNKTSIGAKGYRFVSGFAKTLRGGDGSFRKFLVIRNLRISGAAVEMLLEHV